MQPFEGIRVLDFHPCAGGAVLHLPAWRDGGRRHQDRGAAQARHDARRGPLSTAGNRGPGLRVYQPERQQALAMSRSRRAGRAGDRAQADKGGGRHRRKLPLRRDRWLRAGLRRGGGNQARYRLLLADRFRPYRAEGHAYRLRPRDPGIFRPDGRQRHPGQPSGPRRPGPDRLRHRCAGRLRHRLGPVPAFAHRARAADRRGHAGRRPDDDVHPCGE